MDPDANWKEAVGLAKELVRADERELLDMGEQTARLAELVTELDEWLKKGGFPPKAFTPGRNKK